MREPVAGELYAIPGEDGHGVAKVLVVDEHAVHVRLYREKFVEPPMGVEESQLSIGRFDDPQGFGVGHVPVSRATWAGWTPVFLGASTVSPDELAGYEIWRDAPDAGMF
jgi:hypothetical protein